MRLHFLNSGPAAGPVLLGPRSKAAASSAAPTSARGNLDYDQTGVDARHGIGSKFQMNDGVATTPGNLAKYDGAGNVVDSGIAAVGLSAGTVTHTGGALTADQPVFGAGSADVKVGTKTGNTNALVTQSGAATSGRPLLYDASGNAIAGTVQGNTTKVQLASGSPTTGIPLLYDANGNAVVGSYASGYATDTGAANAYAVTLSPAPALAAGLVLRFIAAHANTAASTLNYAGGGAVAIKKNGNSTALASGDIAANQIIEATYDGSVWQIPVAGSGGAGNTITVGARASLPGSPGAAGSTYLTTDSPYIYTSDGSNWDGQCYGTAADDPALQTLVQLSSGTFTSPTADTTYGGVRISGTVGTDQVLAYARAVTPSSTLLVTLGAQFNGQSGFVIWNNNTGKVVFFRLITNSNFYYSRYQTGGWVANTLTTFGMTAFNQIWPKNGYWAIRFDASNWYLDQYWEVQGITKFQQVYSEALSTWAGTNFTHVGFGINGQSTPCIWGQHLRIAHA